MLITIAVYLSFNYKYHWLTQWDFQQDTFCHVFFIAVGLIVWPVTLFFTLLTGVAKSVYKYLLPER